MSARMRRRPGRPSGQARSTLPGFVAEASLSTPTRTRGHGLVQTLVAISSVSPAARVDLGCQRTDSRCIDVCCSIETGWVDIGLFNLPYATLSCERRNQCGGHPWTDPLGYTTGGWD